MSRRTLGFASRSSHHHSLQEGTHGCKAQGLGQESEEGLSERKKHEEKQSGESTLNMSGDADLVVMQLPRGATAMVWMGQATGTVATSHAVLQVTLLRGVKEDWAVRWVLKAERRFELTHYSSLRLARGSANVTDEPQPSLILR